MDHLFRSKPTPQHIIDKQRIAHHRLHGDTTRTETEIAHYKRSLSPVPLSNVELPKLPLVQPRDASLQARYVVLGEVAQLPGKLVLVDIDAGTLNVHFTPEELELVSP